jgi:hypothetical protein
MQRLTLEQAAHFITLVPIEQTIDLGHTLMHVCNAGTEDQPCRYIFINDMQGESTVSPSFFN